MPEGAPLDRLVTDAVVLLPGIMGSELVDAAGSVVWGMKLSMARAFLSHVYEGVAVTSDELEGRPRLQPSRLIVRTGMLSLFGAQGPYTGLEDALRGAAVDRAAVAAFPYDWRLSVEYNAAKLVEFADRHLNRWIATLKGLVVASDGPLRRFDADSIRLCFVAHSMGGLVARRACQDLRLAGKVRRIVSLGTPYRGSAKTVSVLNAGSVAPFLDEDAARRLAVTCPGVYDLLPRDACLQRNGRWHRLSAHDVGAMGGSAELAVEAIRRGQAIDPSLPLAGIETIPITGYTIPTPTTVRLGSGGEWIPEAVDWQGYQAYGDGTVANLGPPAGSVAHLQVGSHEQLPGSTNTIPVVIQHLLGSPEPPVPLAPQRELGLTVPPTAPPGKVVIRVNELGVAATAPAGITVSSVAETGEGRWSARVGWSFGGVADGDLVFSRGLAPGIHRISATGGGGAGVHSTMAVLSDE